MAGDVPTSHQKYQFSDACPKVSSNYAVVSDLQILLTIFPGNWAAIRIHFLCNVVSILWHMLRLVFCS